MRRSRRTQGGATPKNFDKWIAQARSMAKKDIRTEANAARPRRRSKRHSAVATPSPKNFEEMLKVTARLARESIYEEACARKPKHKGPPFRLLNLPPEVRMCIFEYMVFRPYPLHLGDLVAPLITGVSKQVRAECIASFFALNTFQVFVDTNICLGELMHSFCEQYGSLRAARQNPNLIPNDRGWIDLIYRFDRQSGGFLMLPGTARWLDTISPEVAVFRNVEVIIQDTFGHPTLCVSNMQMPRALQTAWLIPRNNPRGRNRITVTLRHSMQLVPHFVNVPADHPTVRYDYYESPLQRLYGLFDMNHPVFRTFNFNAVKALAYAIGHWGHY